MSQKLNGFWHGQNGYSLPADRLAATVTFQINESDGGYLQLTVVLHRHFETYDELVTEAYARLAQRLEGIGKTAEGLKKRTEQEHAKKTAGQPAA
jgi:hypothetical protein